MVDQQYQLPLSLRSPKPLWWRRSWWHGCRRGWSWQLLLCGQGFLEHIDWTPFLPCRSFKSFDILGLLVFVECLLVLSESYRHVFPHSLYSCHFLSLNGACLPARRAECKEHVGEVAKVLPTQWKVPIRLCTRRTLNQHIPKQRAKWTKRGPNIEGKHLQTCLQKRVPQELRFRLRTPYLLNQNILKTKVKKGGAI